MSNFLSILFAYRNRDLQRVKFGMESLASQENKRFEVIFVDYGSEEKYSLALQELLKEYSFVRYYYVAHPGLLWNKSKALNFAIRKSSTPFIFIADVDLVFPNGTIESLAGLANEENFHLFKLGYLNKTESENVLNQNRQLSPSIVERFGSVNGTVLVSTNAIEKIHGLDEFFHFYGAEDVDLFSRLEKSGRKRVFSEDVYFYHLWHRSFISSESNQLGLQPRLGNIMRLNEYHYFRNREKKLTIPVNQERWGGIKDGTDAEVLIEPDYTYSIKSILAEVEHFLNEELRTARKGVHRVEFTQHEYFGTLKYKLKKILKMDTQVYCSLKEVNDMILKKVVFDYRNYNYSYLISKDLKRLTFTIEITGK